LTVSEATNQPRQHRVVIVGAGSIGERHLRCFLATGRATVSFVEPGELRAGIAERYPAARAFAALEPALAEGVEAAVIATPAPLHVPQATRLAQAGAHLLIEKPLALTLDGVAELQQTVRQRNLIAAVAYVYRAHPALAEMATAIKSGRFGTPVQLVVVTGQNFPTYRPAYRQTYYASRSTGGGAIQDALTHLIDAGQYLVGPITRLAADAAHQVLDGVDVEDTVNVLARHGDVLASYSLNQHQAPNETTITVICDRGTARFEYHANRWRWMEHAMEDWHDEPADTLERDTLFARQANAFLNAIEGNTKPLCTLDEGMAALKANLAILKSAEQACWQQIE
jgi:predicted dehydrogenase